MRFASPETITDAVRLMSEEGARCLSGGQSLVAMMNADLVAPPTLVSLRRIGELSRIEATPDGGLSIGAMATHADPAADYPTAIVCADATVVIAGTGGQRRVPAVEFFKGFYETALAPGEMVVAVEVPPGAAKARAHYEKFALIDGDFAVVSVAAIVGMSGGRCAFARLAVGACAAAPVRDPAAEARLVGTALDDAALDAAAGILVGRCDPIDDYRGSASYRLKLVPRLLKRAVNAAKEKSAHG